MENLNLHIISNRALSAGLRGRAKTAAKQVQNDANLLFNCVERAMRHNDPSHMNKGLALSSMLPGWKRCFYNLSDRMIPFERKGDELVGKMQANKKKKWCEVVETVHGDYRDEKWYHFLVQEFDKVVNQKIERSNKKPVAPTLEVEVKRELARLVKYNINVAEFAQTLIRHAAEQDVLARKVQEVAVGIAEEAQEAKAA